MNRICIFCGSRSGVKPVYQEAAREMGKALARQHIGLVYGGSGIGLMGILAEAVLEGGGDVIGVIPRSLMEREIAHQKLTDLHVVHNMHERKALMYELSDGFIAMPGGIGTLEEFFEIYTWNAIGEHQKPFGLLNVHDYYGQLLDLLDHMVEEDFLRREVRNRVLVEREPDQMIRLLKEAQSHEQRK
ncbi:MAG: TIGR00730 family Rossman fold protein [Bacillaceae bacterium]|nr:TIGR00730 family Rossman fold protein [Bacillaceae bacterium]